MEAVLTVAFFGIIVAVYVEAWKTIVTILEWRNLRSRIPDFADRYAQGYMDALDGKTGPGDPHYHQAWEAGWRKSTRRRRRPAPGRRTWTGCSSTAARWRRASGAVARPGEAQRMGAVQRRVAVVPGSTRRVAVDLRQGSGRGRSAQALSGFLLSKRS